MFTRRAQLDLQDAAPRHDVQRIQGEIDQQLADLLAVGLDQDRGRGRVELQRHPLLAGPATDQGQRLAHHRRQVDEPPLRLRRPCEVDEHVQPPLHAEDLLLDDVQVLRGQAPRLGLLAVGLDQHLDRGQGVPELVGHAGGELPDLRQRLGPQHGPAQAAGHAVAHQQPGERPDGTHPGQPPRHPRDHPMEDGLGALDLGGVEALQLAAGRHDLRLQGAEGLSPRGRRGRPRRGLRLPPQITTEAVLQPAHEPRLLRLVHSPPGLCEKAQDLPVQGARLVPSVHGQGREVIQRLQEIARDPPARDGLVEDPDRGGLLMVQVDGGRDARPEEQQAHEHGRARDPDQEAASQHGLATIEGRCGICVPHLRD